MKQLLLAKLTLGAVVALSLVVVAGAVAQAGHNGQADRQARAAEMREKAKAARETAQATLEQKKAEAQQRLDERRKDTCERREQRINAITDRSVVQAKKQLGVFQKIEDRVKTFYEEKRNMADNYEALAAEADVKEAAAVAAIEATGSVELDCDIEGEQRQVGTYMKELVRSHQTALKEYRTAIKNLIVAVAQAQKQGEGEDSETETETTQSGSENVEQGGSRQEGVRQ